MVRFRLEERQEDSHSSRFIGDADLLIWTSAPWTLPACTSVAVDGEETFAVARRAGHDERVVVAESGLYACSVTAGTSLPGYQDASLPGLLPAAFPARGGGHRSRDPGRGSVPSSGGNDHRSGSDRAGWSLRRGRDPAERSLLRRRWPGHRRRPGRPRSALFLGGLGGKAAALLAVRFAAAEQDGALVVPERRDRAGLGAVTRSVLGARPCRSGSARTVT